MKPVKPVHRIFKDFEKTRKIKMNLAKYKEKDLVEWNKFQAKHTKLKNQEEDEADELLAGFTFEDRKCYQAYLNLCASRDSMIPLSDKRINELKQQDPVFNKRYEKWYFSTLCQRPPKFEAAEINVSKFISKKAMENVKRDIMAKRAAKEEFEHGYKKDVAIALERSKTFIKMLSELEEQD